MYDTVQLTKNHELELERLQSKIQQLSEENEHLQVHVGLVTAIRFS